MTTTTLNKLTYSLMELRRNEIKTTDSLPIKLVKSWVASTRARLLNQKFAKPFTTIDSHFIQQYSNNGAAIQMEKVLSNNASVDVFDYVYRTAIEIPHTIERKGGLGTFTRIGPADKLRTKFNIVSYDRALVSGNGYFNRNFIYAYVVGDYIYLTSKSGIHFTVKYIDIYGVFQDPIAAAVGHDSTWTHDDDYPVNQSMIDQMHNLIISEKFKLVLTPISDVTDDLEENVESNIKAPEQERRQQ